MAQPQACSLSLDFLTKLIPAEFNGDRLKIRSFVKQVDATFELAQDNQKNALLLYVKSKITGKAREQIDIHCNLTTWEEISELLLNLYQDKKSLDQLLQELNSIQQGRNESVSDFYQRLEDLNSRVLAALHSTETNAGMLKGRIAMISDMSLNRFVYHTCPPISQMLRYRDFSKISDAFTAAIAEEKILKAQNFKQGNFHDYRDKRVYFAQPINNSVQCHYCKKQGHLIKDCRKRQFNGVNRFENFNRHNHGKFSQNKTVLRRNNYFPNQDRNCQPSTSGYQCRNQNGSQPQQGNINFQRLSLQTDPPDLSKLQLETFLT